MGMIAKFVSSKFSGYALIALMIAAAGAGYWFWTELKELGSLEAQSQSQAETIAQQSDMLTIIRAESDKRQQVNTVLAQQMATIKRTFSAVRKRITDAEANAEKALRECMAMRISDGMRFGTSREDPSDKSKAEPTVDG